MRVHTLLLSTLYRYWRDVILSSRLTKCSRSPDINDATMAFNEIVRGSTARIKCLILTSIWRRVIIIFDFAKRCTVSLAIGSNKISSLILSMSSPTGQLIYASKILPIKSKLRPSISQRGELEYCM